MSVSQAGRANSTGEKTELARFLEEVYDRIPGHVKHPWWPDKDPATLPAGLVAPRPG